MKLPAGFQAEVQASDAEFRAVVVRGAVNYMHASKTATMKLPTGSYFGSAEAAAHNITCTDEAECVIYVRTEGRYAVAGL